eukprot:CAMPEP_0181289966 /NCGR_PEP_ID=MMETSP1101-20121128/1168_1 /TAXON_ID=46948 /ORGANISM="Rhodomonas abbreviata, Strain Caron Lab Isolate" /LENGTH=142 /DNA_ID=CAMNT_0023394231 /DNA_START=23 /DNA_END=451 /DNA_ORIENTATION=+
MAMLEKCPESSRDQVEEYRREWKMLSMRWRIYDNETTDCQKEIASLAAKKEASKLVRKHLTTELADAEKRLALIQEEIHLIKTQLEQQHDKDEQVELDIAEKKRRLQLIGSTKDTLGTERDKIRLMVQHYVPAADVDAVLDA